MAHNCFNSLMGSSPILPFLFPPRIKLVHNPRPRKVCCGLPRIVEALYIGDNLSAQQGFVNIQDAVLQGLNQLMLHIPSHEDTWWAIIAPATLYMFATPGPLAGLIDFLYAPIHENSIRSFSPANVEIGRKLGEGSFGIVYEGFLKQDKKIHVVMKKAKTHVTGAREIHNSEVRMNYRLQRTASLACTEFLGTMEVRSSDAHGKLSEGIWLVWKFQGSHTLDYYIKQRNFPENIGRMIIDKNEVGSSKEDRFRWNATVIQTIFKQILIDLQYVHRSGIVHRDVKPLNLVLDQATGNFKLIDFGASVDLRTGYNYVPNETVIDPTYAAPEQYVMPTSTPHLPPDPICSFISPIFWHINTPDRFDLYSAGLILMQLTMRPLRHDTGLASFNTELKRYGYNLNKWRSQCRYGRDEFAFLDANDGAGWELATALLQPRSNKESPIWRSLGNSRPSAYSALRHRYVSKPVDIPKLTRQDITDDSLPLLSDLRSQIVQKLNISSLNISIPKLSVHYMVAKSNEILKVSFLQASNDEDNDLRKIISTGPELLKIRIKSTQTEPLLSSSSSPVIPTRASLNKIITAVESAISLNMDGVAEDERKEDEVTVQEEEVFVKADQHFLSSFARRALPSTAMGVTTLVAAWLVFSELGSSVQISYELGKSLVATSGISGSAFFTFFFLIKPWLEEQSVTTRKLEIIEVNEIQSQQDMLIKRHNSGNREQFEVHVILEAVENLEVQISSFESRMLKEKQEQKALVRKMEGLLLQSSVVPALGEINFDGSSQIQSFTTSRS